MEQSARRRPGSVLAVFVINASMARTHEQARLREPRHRTTQMGTIDGKDQEPVFVIRAHAQVADKDGVVGRYAVPALAQGIVEGLKPGLVPELPELADGPQVDPANRVLARGTQEITDEGNRHCQGGQQARDGGQPHEEALRKSPPADDLRSTERVTGVVGHDTSTFKPTFSKSPVF